MICWCWFLTSSCGNEGTFGGCNVDTGEHTLAAGRFESLVVDTVEGILGLALADDMGVGHGRRNTGNALKELGIDAAGTNVRGKAVDGVGLGTAVYPGSTVAETGWWC